MSGSAYFRTPDCIFHWCETRRRARVWSAFFGRPGVIIYLLAVLIFRINFGSICINQWRTALSNLFELQRTFAKIHASLSNANTKKVPSWFASSALIYSCFTISRPRGIAFPVKHFYFPFHYSYSSVVRCVTFLFALAITLRRKPCFNVNLLFLEMLLFSHYHVIMPSARQCVVIAIGIITNWGVLGWGTPFNSVVVIRRCKVSGYGKKLRSGCTFRFFLLWNDVSKSYVFYISISRC